MADQTYNYDITSGSLKDKMRMMIPDHVNKGNPRQPAMFSDQELEAILGLPIVGNDLIEAVATACEIVAGSEAKRQAISSVSVSSGMSISRAQNAKFWMDRAKQMRENAANQPFEFIDAVDYRIDRFGQDKSHYVGNQALIDNCEDEDEW